MTTTRKQKKSPAPAVQRIRRSTKDRVLGGVCGGLGDYFELDPVVFRIVFVLFTIFGGSGILIYIALWLIIPATSDAGDVDIHANAEEMGTRIREISASVGKKDSTTIIAYMLVGVGVWLLLSQFGFLRYLHVERAWPLLFVVFGIVLLNRSRKSS